MKRLSLFFSRRALAGWIDWYRNRRERTRRMLLAAVLHDPCDEKSLT